MGQFRRDAAPPHQPLEHAGIGSSFSRALVIGASGGTGAAIAAGLEENGAEVCRLSRRDDGLDVCDERSIARAAAKVNEEFDLIFIATGVLEVDGARPEKSFLEIDPRAMAAVFATNAIGPALLIKHFAGKLSRERRAVLAALSARVGSIGDNRLGGWASYRASKAALNQIVRTASIEIARSRAQAAVVALHPGTVETQLSAEYARGHARMPAPEAARKMLRVMERLTPADTGKFFAYDGAEIPW